MSVGDLVIFTAVAAGALCLWALVAHWVLDNPTGEPQGGIVWRLFRIYSRVVHRLRVEGKGNIPRQRDAGPLIVVCNHTAGVDPVLVQAVCRFKIRWMMAADMQLDHMAWLWEIGDVITVHRGQRDMKAAREAIRHLERGGVLGIFPEGGIERPPRRIMPFVPGVGLVIRKTGARVLPVLIDGTPQVDPAWASLWRTSKSVVKFGEIVDYSDSPMSADEITKDLERRYREWSGWGEGAEQPARP